MPEVCFPRGGKLTQSQEGTDDDNNKRISMRHENSFPINTFIFGSKAKKPKLKDQEVEDDSIVNLDIEKKKPSLNHPKRSDSHHIPSSDFVYKTKKPSHETKLDMAITLSYKILNVGMIVMGSVERLTELYAVISLPHTLKGQLKIVEVTDSLTKRLKKDLADRLAQCDEDDGMDDTKLEMINSMGDSQFANSLDQPSIESVRMNDFLHLGQCLPFYILEKNYTTKGLPLINVSCRESLLNAHIDISAINPGFKLYGSISTIEDYGYSVSLGLNGLSHAFLPFSQNQQASSPKFQIGQLLLFKVQDYQKDTQLVKLECERDSDAISIPSLSRKKASKSNLGGLNSLYVGMRASCTVEQVLSNGLSLSISSIYNGTVNITHICIDQEQRKRYLMEHPDQVDPCQDSDDYSFGRYLLSPQNLAYFYTPKSTISASILFIDYKSKLLGFTILPHLNGKSLDLFTSTLGQVFDQTFYHYTEFYHQTPILSILNDNRRCLAYCSRSRDTEEQKLPSQLKSNKMKCRIIGFQHLDAMIHVTLNDKEINEPYFFYKDIQVGQVLSGKVMSVQSNGLTVYISKYIHGFCPFMHISDTLVRSPELLYHPNQSIQVRTLKVDPDLRTLLVTCKKTLIQSKLPILADIKNIQPGVICHGVIMTIQARSIGVSFFNGTFGFVPIQYANLDSQVEKLSDQYKLAQVVKCLVISVDQEKNSFILSLDTSATIPTRKMTAEEVEKAQQYLNKSNDTFISATVVARKEHQIQLMWRPREDVKIPVSLHIAHLSDFHTLSEQLVDSFDLEQTINNLLIIRKTKLKVFVTMKQSLLNFSSQPSCPTKIEEILPNSVYPAYITSILDRGIIVSFLNSIQTMIQKPQLGDFHVGNLNQHFSVGQSLLVFIQSVHLDKSSIVATLRHKSCLSPGIEWIRNYLHDRRRIKASDNSIDWSNYKQGKVIKAKVMKIEEYGVLLSVNDTLMVFAHKLQLDDTGQDVNSENHGLSTGEYVRALILDVDRKRNIIDVSLRKDMIKLFRHLQKSSSNLVNQPEIDSILDATVELIKRDYLILSIPKYPGMLVTMAVRDFNNPISTDPFNIFKVQQTLTIQIGKVRPRILAHQINKQSSILSFSTGLNQSGLDSIGGLKVGMVVSAKVHSVKPSLVVVTIDGNRTFAYIPISEIKDLVLPRECPLNLTSLSINQKKKNKALNVLLDFQQTYHLSLASLFEQDQILDQCRVIAIRHSNNRIHSDPATFVPNNTPQIFLSMRPAQTSQFERDAKQHANESDPSVPSHDSADVTNYSLGKYQNDDIVPFWINKITRNTVHVVLQNNVLGQIYPGDLSHDIECIQNPSDHFQVGQFLFGVVIASPPSYYIHSSDSNSTLESIKFRSLQISLRALEGIETPSSHSRPYCYTKINVGDLINCRIHSLIRKFGIKVELFRGVYGKIYSTDLDDDLQDLDLFLQKHKDHYLSARVLDICPSQGPSGDNQLPNYYLSTRNSRVNLKGISITSPYPEINSFDDVKENTKVFGCIQQILKDKDLVVVGLSRTVYSMITFMNLPEGLCENPEKSLQVGQMVKAYVISVDKSQKKIKLSMKKHLVERMTMLDVHPGMKFYGNILSITKFGIFVMLENSNISGLCHITEVFHPECSSDHEAVQINVDEADKMSEVSPSLGEDSHNQSAKTNSQVTVNKPNLETDKDINLYPKLVQKAHSCYKIGDRVRVLILRVNLPKNQLSLSMLPSHFKNDGPIVEADHDQKNTSSANNQSALEFANSVEKYSVPSSDIKLLKALQRSKKRTLKFSEVSQDNLYTLSDEIHSECIADDEKDYKDSFQEKIVDHLSSEDQSDSPMEVTNEELQASEHEIQSNQSSDEDQDDSPLLQEALVPLPNKLFANNDCHDLFFQSNHPLRDGQDAWYDFSDVDVPMTNIPSSSHAQKSSKLRLTLEDQLALEEDVITREKKLLNPNRELENENDFECALIANPNSSYLWIKYVAFNLFQTNVDKARKTMERALERIDHSLESERLNIWIAYMNLENQYGAPVSFELLFRRAVLVNEPKIIYQEAIKSHLRVGHIEEAETLYQLILKKWKHCKSSWINWVTFKFQQNEPEAARTALNSSLDALASRKHIPTLIKFAQLEFAHGDSERARTILENLLSSYPKRTDIWSIYLDMELKYKNITNVKNLFERIITLKLTSKKMKPFFKRYLSFELEYGNPTTVEYVKGKALEFIEGKF